MKTENVEQIQRLKEDYSRQMQESRYEKLLNSYSPADREAINFLAQLSDRVGGINKLNQVYYMFQTIMKQK